MNCQFQLHLKLRRGGNLLRRVPGAVDVSIEQEGPQPQLVIQPDRLLCSRYDVRVEDVAQLINTAVGGQPISQIYQGEQRFDIVVKFGREHLRSVQQIERLPAMCSVRWRRSSCGGLSARQFSHSLLFPCFIVSSPLACLVPLRTKMTSLPCRLPLRAITKQFEPTNWDMMQFDVSFLFERTTG